jgi:hypothetical protein
MLSLSPPQEHILSVLRVCTEVPVKFVTEVGCLRCTNRREGVEKVLRLHSKSYQLLMVKLIFKKPTFVNLESRLGDVKLVSAAAKAWVL